MIKYITYTYITEHSMLQSNEREGMYFCLKNTQEIIIRLKEKIPVLLYVESHDR